MLDELYGADEYDVLAICAAKVPSDAQTAMVVGHNPTMAMTAWLIQPEERGPTPTSRPRASPCSRSTSSGARSTPASALTRLTLRTTLTYTPVVSDRSVGDSAQSGDGRSRGGDAVRGVVGDDVLAARCRAGRGSRRGTAR